MTDKERLEILRKRFETANVVERIGDIEVVCATKDDLNWLIKQAELVHSIGALAVARINTLVDENIRWREALEDIARNSSCTIAVCRSRKELEDVKNG